MNGSSSKKKLRYTAETKAEVISYIKEYKLRTDVVVKKKLLSSTESLLLL